MPTILRLLGFRFFFYSDEGNEPPHVHIEKGEGEAKYWLDPLEEEFTRNFKASDKRKIKKILAEHQEQFKNDWNEYFDQ
ncbi:MAG: DUF4160 domain-containing protein [Bacteroidota bacterium]